MSFSRLCISRSKSHVFKCNDIKVFLSYRSEPERANRRFTPDLQNWMHSHYSRRTSILKYSYLWRTILTLARLKKIWMLSSSVRYTCNCVVLTTVFMQGLGEIYYHKSKQVRKRSNVSISNIQDLKIRLTQFSLRFRWAKI